MSETPDELIATAMLLGIEFLQIGPHSWTAHGMGRHTGVYNTKDDAALGWLRKSGFELDFNGDLYNTKEK